MKKNNLEFSELKNNGLNDSENRKNILKTIAIEITSVVKDINVSWMSSLYINKSFAKYKLYNEFAKFIKKYGII